MSAELEEVLCQEELLWFQQSRENWIKSSDRITTFYHLSTLVRKKQQRGHILKDTLGRVIGDWEESGKFVQVYFNDIFSYPNTDTMQTLGRGFPNINKDCWSELNCPVSQEEVKKALFAMAPYKAPGPNGFPTGFYQKAWEIVGSSICGLVIDYLKTEILPKGINDTLISLIPKIAHPENVT